MTRLESDLPVDRRGFMKLATAAGIVAPADFMAQPTFAATSSRPARTDEPAPKERAMGIGGFSTSRLDRMHDVMAGYVKRGDMPGIVLLLCRRGEVYVDAIGTTAVGGRDPMRRDTIFRIASLSKPVVAVAALVLVEECKLRLDEPVDRLLPELANRRVLTRIDGPLDETVAANRPITVRDLLTFRMGFGIIMVPPGTYPIQRAAVEQQNKDGAAVAAGAARP